MFRFYQLNFRVLDFFKTKLFYLEKKLNLFQRYFSITLFFIFLGFIFGNLFGTFLGFLNDYLFWTGFVVILLIFFIEVINFINYRSEKLSVSKKLKKNIIWRVINFFKIGLLFGFFVDAFKVGS